MKPYSPSIILLIFCILAFVGCDKYLDVTPRGKRLLSSAADYDQWLNDQSLIIGAGQFNGLLDYLGDNADIPNIAVPPTKDVELIYTWAPQFSVNINDVPWFWGEHYAKINLFNTVLVGIDEATGGTEAQKRSLRAEALLGRALEYFYLVNEYSKPYDSATVSQDLAVPFVTSNDVSQQVPPRSTTAQLYEQLIGDLNSALADLPDDNSANRYRGSKAAAYSLLARIYFYARNYTDARANAEQALAHSQATMIDFNGTLPASDLISIRTDVIYGRMVLGNITPTLDFMRSFATNDLRVRKLYLGLDGYSFMTRGATYFLPAYLTPVFAYTNTGTSVQEMKLIIAESAARNDELSVALQQLNDVRKNRFATATYTPYASSNKEAVLQEVLTERIHELPFCGLRWFDMRRLDQEGSMPPVNRYDAQDNIIATLPAHSSRYTLQIPAQVLNFNPDMPQNP